MLAKNDQIEQNYRKLEFIWVQKLGLIWQMLMKIGTKKKYFNKKKNYQQKPYLLVFHGRGVRNQST